MEEWRVQVDGIVMTASVFADVEHSGAAQVSDEAPHRSPGESHGFGDFVGRAVRVDGDVEDDSAVAGNEIKAANEAPSTTAL